MRRWYDEANCCTLQIGLSAGLECFFHLVVRGWETDATRNDAICGGQGRPKKIIRDNKECVIRYIMTYDEVV